VTSVGTGDATVPTVGRSIELDLLESLTRLGALEAVRVTDVLVHRSFAAVRLSSGAVGAAMNYAVYPTYALALYEAAEREAVAIRAEVRHDPCLRRYLLDRHRAELTLTEQAVKVAIMSALSQPHMSVSALHARGFQRESVTYRQHHMPKRPVPQRRLLEQLFERDCAVGIVGFGGLLEIVAAMPTVREIRIIDRHTEHRREYISAVLANLNARAGYEKVRPVKSDPSDLRGCDVISITASTLANGSIDELIAAFAGSRLIVQGPSGAVVPEPFFARGVSLMCVECKDEGFIDAYRFDDRAYDWYVEFDDRVYIAPAEQSLNASLAAEARPLPELEREAE
jgi:uncharacterized protein (DUF4213/DUF364 family)